MATEGSPEAASTQKHRRRDTPHRSHGLRPSESESESPHGFQKVPAPERVEEASQRTKHRQARRCETPGPHCVPSLLFLFQQNHASNFTNSSSRARHASRSFANSPHFTPRSLRNLRMQSSHRIAGRPTERDPRFTGHQPKNR